MALPQRRANAHQPATESGGSGVSPPGAISDPLPTLIDSDRFTPRLLALLSNALVWRESMLLRQEFNLGTNDWRVISALATRPGSSATDVSEFLAMNKAVVSKAVNTLINRHLIVAEDGPRGSRHLYLTSDGAETHDQMRPISLAGEDIILANLSNKEVNQFRAILIKLVEDIPLLTTSPDASL
jgi:DNA-binding MarR family transcriptional regulator